MHTSTETIRPFLAGIHCKPRRHMSTAQRRKFDAWLTWLAENVAEALYRAAKRDGSEERSVRARLDRPEVDVLLDIGRCALEQFGRAPRGSEPAFPSIWPRRFDASAIRDKLHCASVLRDGLAPQTSLPPLSDELEDLTHSPPETNVLVFAKAQIATPHPIRTSTAKGEALFEVRVRKPSRNMSTAQRRRFREWQKWLRREYVAALSRGEEVAQTAKRTACGAMDHHDEDALLDLGRQALIAEGLAPSADEPAFPTVWPSEWDVAAMRDSLAIAAILRDGLD